MFPLEAPKNSQTPVSMAATVSEDTFHKLLCKASIRQVKDLRYLKLILYDIKDDKIFQSAITCSKLETLEQGVKYV